MGFSSGLKGLTCFQVRSTLHLLAISKVMFYLLQVSSTGTSTDTELPILIVHQNQLDSVGYSNYLGSMVTNDARYTWKVKCRIAMAKAAFNNKKILSPPN
jgi:glucosamine 6-phosphate synthetase-like amidotransferase/phosphosugar isomerase protein